MITHPIGTHAGPTAAELVRTVLARAVSLSLTTAGQDYDLFGLHSVGTDGGITLHPQPDSPLSRQVAGAPGRGPTAVLEFTDIAPTAVRDRVRARATLTGRLSSAADDGLRLAVTHVRLDTAAGAQVVGLHAFARAQADPSPPRRPRC